MTTAPTTTDLPIAPAIRSPLTLIAARPEHAEQVLSLFGAVTAADPDYAPVVTSGEMTLADWFTRKPADGAILAYEGDLLVGHVAVRHNHVLPGGARTAHARPLEMCRLAVHPDAQRQGVASVLVRAVHRRHGDSLWATCHAGYGSHRLLTGLGWVDQTAVAWADDPRAGVCLYAPTILTFPTPEPASSDSAETSTGAQA